MIIRYFQEATAEYKRFCYEIQKANDVIIVGGGSVGIEMAGEISEKYFLKRVTIIHNSEELVSKSLGEPFQQKLKKILKDNGIRTILGNP